MNELDVAGELRCANCATPMGGEFCHHCGQSIHSVLKPVHGMLEDAMDIALHVDGRIMQTLPALLLKPGRLTLEYFAGRRVRYVAPFRLMFVLCLLAFFVCHSLLDGHRDEFGLDLTANNSFAGADSSQAVQQQLDQQLDQLRQQRAQPNVSSAAASALALAERGLRNDAERRRRQLTQDASTAPQPSSATGAPEPLIAAHTKLDQVRIGWLPDALNQRLNRSIEHLRNNLNALGGADPAQRQDAIERMIEGVFGALPPAMFVLVPVFALLLKLFYLFRRRLYMEHLIVALHSHAFLFLLLLLLALDALLGGWLSRHATWAVGPTQWLQWLLCLWAPIYLLAMQKRVYRQGWPLTLLKFACVGWCYLWLLSAALIIAGLLGMSH